MGRAIKGWGLCICRVFSFGFGMSVSDYIIIIIIITTTMIIIIFLLLLWDLGRISHGIKDRGLVIRDGI